LSEVTVFSDNLTVQYDRLFDILKSARDVKVKYSEDQLEMANNTIRQMRYFILQAIDRLEIMIENE